MSDPLPPAAESPAPPAPKKKMPTGKRFPKGVSGNPTGKRKTPLPPIETPQAIPKKLLEMVPDALEELRGIITGERPPSQVRVQAIKLLLDKVIANAVPEAKGNDDAKALEKLADALAGD